MTPAVQTRRDEVRAFRLALLQNTEACKNKMPWCAGGKYGPPAPERDQPMPQRDAAVLEQAGPHERRAEPVEGNGGQEYPDRERPEPR